MKVNIHINTIIAMYEIIGGFGKPANLKHYFCALVSLLPFIYEIAIITISN